MFTESMKTTIPKFPVDTALVIVKIVIKKMQKGRHNSE